MAQDRFSVPAILTDVTNRDTTDRSHTTEHECVNSEVIHSYLRQHLKVHQYSGLRVLAVQQISNYIVGVVFRDGKHGMIEAIDLVKEEPDVFDILAFEGIIRRTLL